MLYKRVLVSGCMMGLCMRSTFLQSVSSSVSVSVVLCIYNSCFDLFVYFCMSACLLVSMLVLLFVYTELYFCLYVYRCVRTSVVCIRALCTHACPSVCMLFCLCKDVRLSVCVSLRVRMSVGLCATCLHINTDHSLISKLTCFIVH